MSSKKFIIIFGTWVRFRGLGLPPSGYYPTRRDQRIVSCGVRAARCEMRVARCEMRGARFSRRKAHGAGYKADEGGTMCLRISGRPDWGVACRP